MESASHKEAQISFTELGKGQAVVLLHGFLEDNTILEPLARHLASRFRVINIDLPGHGKSDCLGYVHSMEEMAGAVKTVLQKKRIRKCTIVGHSMGGYVALAFGDLNPDMVRGICLLHSSAADDTTKKKKDRNRMIELVRQKKSSLIKELIPGLFAEQNRKKFRKDISRIIKRAEQTPVQGIVAALTGMRDRIDREIIVHFSPYAVHYIIGKNDPVFNYREIISQCEKTEKATYLLLEKSGHMGFIEEKEIVEANVFDFVRACSSYRYE